MGKMLIFNWLAPVRLNWMFRWTILKLMLVIVGWSISCEIDLRSISLDLTVSMEGNGLVPSGNPFWIFIVFVIAVTKTKCIVLQQPCDYFSILMSSIKPLLVALGPGPKLNGYSITYVIHSLRTSCSELEWVWNSADYCRPRHFQEHVVLITNDHLTSLVS